MPVDLNQWYLQNRERLCKEYGENRPIVIYCVGTDVDFFIGDANQEMFEFCESINEKLDKLGVDLILVIRLGDDLPLYGK